ncbi:oxygenase MpaB family protein [Streptomyces sp. NPDC001793]|uniref:oxygenase MpaB family protein n=1 Tax=Streptomyces sp. NPDC001793 TaxID=3154657 RepID=UPI0033318DB4
MRDVGRVRGLSERQLPPDWASFRADCDTVVAERLEHNDAVGDVLAELARLQKPPVWWIPALLWRPCAALAAHYALLVTIGVLPPRPPRAVRARGGPTGSSAGCGGSPGWCAA